MWEVMVSKASDKTTLGVQEVNVPVDVVTSTGIATKSPAVNSSTSAPVVKLIGVPKLVVFSSAAETTDEQVATVAAAKHKLKTLFNFIFFYLLLLTLIYFPLEN